MKEFKEYFEEAEEVMGGEGEAVSASPEAEDSAPMEEPVPTENGESEGVEDAAPNGKPEVKLKDSVFLDDNGQVVVRLATTKKQLTPEEYFQKYLTAVLTKAEYEEK
jgi:hypothetical protein